MPHKIITLSLLNGCRSGPRQSFERNRSSLTSQTALQCRSLVKTKFQCLLKMERFMRSAKNACISMHFQMTYFLMTKLNQLVNITVSTVKEMEKQHQWYLDEIYHMPCRIPSFWRLPFLRLSCFKDTSIPSWFRNLNFSSSSKVLVSFLEGTLSMQQYIGGKNLTVNFQSKSGQKQGGHHVPLWLGYATIMRPNNV